MNSSIKKIFFVVPPLLLFAICFAIGFNASKRQWLYPVFDNNWSWILHMVFVGIIIILLIGIIVILNWFIKKKVFALISAFLIVFLYIASTILSLVFSLPFYHISYTTDLDNYLLCDDSTIGEEASKYFPKKEDFDKYECEYSYCYKSYPVLDQDFEIRLRIDYNNDYWALKESILIENQKNVVDNMIIIFNYKTYNDHFRKFIIIFYDDDEVIEYDYSDHISNR